MQKKALRILVTNDDGINAPGLVALAEEAKKFGDVTVIAPAEQCSGMSVKLTIQKPMIFSECKDFPVHGVKAYSLAGTPADCAKLAIKNIFPEKPDYVFSGINAGFNAGFDCMYSGTIGAIHEALTFGVKAIAFSVGDITEGSWIGDCNFDIFNITADNIIKELMNADIEKNAFWNVNFPACPREQFRGILHNTKLSQVRPYDDIMRKDILPDGTVTYTLVGNLINKESTPVGSDIHAVLNGYVSIGKVFNSYITPD